LSDSLLLLLLLSSFPPSTTVVDGATVVVVVVVAAAVVVLVVAGKVVGLPNWPFVTSITAHATNQNNAVRAVVCAAYLLYIESYNEGVYESSLYALLDRSALGRLQNAARVCGKSQRVIILE